MSTWRSVWSAWAEFSRGIGCWYTRLWFGSLTVLLTTVPEAGYPRDLDRYCESDTAEVAPPAVPVEPATGMLWRITGGASTSHLFGTIHLSDERVLALPEPVRQAFEGAGRLVLEVDFDGVAQRVFARASRTNDNSYLERELGGPVLTELTRIATGRYGLTADLVSNLRPWALFTLLGRPPPGERPILDEYLRRQAIARGIQVFGLETVTELISALDGMAAADQVEILVDTVCNHGLLEQQAQQLLDLYLARDLAGMVTQTATGHADRALFERLLERVLYRRNQRMLDRMERHLAHGGSFIAVGALHLPGPRGLLAGLEERGYRVAKLY